MFIVHCAWLFLNMALRTSTIVLLGLVCGLTLHVSAFRVGTASDDVTGPVAEVVRTMSRHHIS